jgi:hypothetical protein
MRMRPDKTQDLQSLARAKRADDWLTSQFPFQREADETYTGAATSHLVLPRGMTICWYTLLVQS